MNSCKEFQLDDLMAITAVPIANIGAGDPSSPVNRIGTTVPSFSMEQLASLIRQRSWLRHSRAMISWAEA